MKPSEISILLKSPAIKVLRKDTAAIVLSFLFEQFKIKNNFWVLEEELRSNLRHFLEDSREEGNLSESDFLRSPETYIQEWVNDGFLSNRIRTSEGFDEVILELTPETEKVFSWLEEIKELQDKEVVSTESRFFSILNKLQEIVEETISSPEDKIAQLEQKRKDIDIEIERIQKNGRVDVFPSQRIQSQYLYARKEAHGLISDFKQVEGNFYDLTQAIHRKYLDIVGKGEILASVLEQDAALLDSPQGRSFQAFWDFLRSDRHQEFLEKTIRALYDIPDVLEVDTDRFFKKFRKNLREAGARVNSVVSQMSEQLKKTLVDRTLKENRKTKELIAEIKTQALNSDLSSEENFYFLERIEIRLIMEKPLWKGDDIDTIREIQIDDQEVEDFDWKDLSSSMVGVDPEILIENVQTLLRYKPEVDLEEILQTFPISSELEEIVTYLWIAGNDENHSIQENHFFRFAVDKENIYRIYNIPKTTYRVGKTEIGLKESESLGFDTY
ncbi:PF11855 family protein [Leptospira kirschneri str. JB]|uniref:DUF3375 family protein n=1 Tax=Leptospira kirschneri TaxID=29507 RepID=UPI0002BEEBAE|nr:PF11855 family protein [Leptospira kirschneri str. JB]